MRKMMFLGVTCLLAPFVLAGGKFQPLNVKIGLWQTTMTTVTTGRPPIPADTLARMTPEQRAKAEAMLSKMASGVPTTRTYKSCVTKEKLNQNPFSEPDKKCTWTVLSSTGSKIDARGTCMPGSEDVKIDVTVRLEALDSEKVKGTGQLALTSGGHTMNSNYTVTAKWIGSACGDTK